MTRETLDVDILIVGGGPAGLSAALRLAQLQQQDGGEPLSVAVLDKAREFGAHLLSGAVIDPSALRELVPDFAQRGAPLAAEVHDEASVVDHSDAIGPTHRAEPVCHHDDGATLHEPFERLFHHGLGAGVEVARRLVEHQHRRVDQRGAGQRHELTLARRQPRAALTHLGLEALGELVEPFAHTDRVERGGDFVVGRRRSGDADVVEHGAAEQEALLRHDDDAFPQRPSGRVTQRHAAVTDLAVDRVVEARHELGQRRLAGPRRADEREVRHRLATGMRVLCRGRAVTSTTSPRSVRRCASISSAVAPLLANTSSALRRTAPGWQLNLPRLARQIELVLAVGPADSERAHITQPDPDADGASRSIRNALRDAGLGPEEVDYVSAHATATDVGDLAETAALKLVFGERAYQVPVSALKSQIGHLLGGSGGVETIAAVQTIRTGMILPTLNLEHPGEGCDLDYVPLRARAADVRVVVKSSFGFGGQNAVLVLRRYEDLP